MSKAFFQPLAIPQLIYRCSNITTRTSKNESSLCRTVEVWTTACIVQNFGKASDAACSVLVNPSNAGLTGVSEFPYFPRGGPVPNEKPTSMHKDWQPLGHVSYWGGMEVGTGMMYPVSVVDGLVHSLGGWKLRVECSMKRIFSKKREPCPVGQAVTSRAPGNLSKHFDAIVHTTPPFHKFNDKPEHSLKSCYQQALSLAFAHRRHDESAASLRVALPLLGAGARGFPEDTAIRIAASEAIHWCHANNEKDSYGFGEQVLAFGLLEKRSALVLAEEIKDAVLQHG